MARQLIRFAAIAVAAALVPGTVQAQDHEKTVTEYVKKNIVPWLSNATVIKAVNASNKKHQALQQADIAKMDGEWIKLQKDKSPNPMLDALTKNELAQFLKKKRDGSKGVVTEFFVMDDKGLNVGQTDPTSDLWQGDEAKWQKTFSVGPGAIFVDKVEDDGGKKISQASLTISDPKTKKPIGAITVLVDTGKLPK